MSCNFLHYKAVIYLFSLIRRRDMVVPDPPDITIDKYVNPSSTVDVSVLLFSYLPPACYIIPSWLTLFVNIKRGLT